MRVWAQHDLTRDAVLVYVQVNVSDNPNDKRTFLGDHGQRIYEVAPGAEAPLYMPPIPTHIAEQIGLALAPRPEATERHLDDAINVRDRLLTIVEHVASPPRMIDMGGGGVAPRPER